VAVPVDQAGEGRAQAHGGSPDDLASAGVAGADSVPTGAVLASMVMAGVGAELIRRRRQFQRHRRPGEHLGVPTRGAADLESAARAALHDPLPDLLDRALTALAEGAHAVGRALPEVRLVRVGPQGVALELVGPCEPALAPFRSADVGRWVADAGDVPTGSGDPGGAARAFPGLVTLGTWSGETILLNLAEVGTLAVSGPAGTAGDALRAIAADLTFGPASSQTERILCMGDAGVARAAEAGSIGLIREQDRVAAMLESLLADAGHTSPEAGVAPTDPSQSDPYVIVLADAPIPVAVHPNRACALITSAPAGSGVGARLVIDTGGQALLLPEREPLEPQLLSSTGAGRIVELLRTTDLPEDGTGPQLVPTGAPGTRASTGTTELRDPSGPMGSGIIDLRERPRRETRPDPIRVELHSDPSAPRVLLLGEIRVENADGKAESTRIGRLGETAAFVLLNPGARPSELQGALWPGRRSNPQTCRQMISRTRTWLGRTADGDPFLMTFASTEGRLRLRPEVGSDWSDFQRLAQAGLADPDDTAHLSAALDLVRARPFGAVAARELPWADLHINEMISLITDVACALAARREAAGDRSGAHEAALRGLLTESESEVLEAIAMRTAP
jgi:hypothetical protein